VRKTTGILLATASLLSLSACAAGGTAACDDGVPLGGLAATIVSDGGFDEAPAPAQFPTPLVVDAPSRAITMPGDGRLVRAGDAVSAKVTLFKGADGTLIDGGDILLFDNDPALPLLAASTCAPVGSRVVTAAPAEDLLGSFAPNFGVEAGDTVVAVLDIQAAFPGHPSGVTVDAIPGLPAVVTAPNGQPGLTFNGDPAPAELTVETLVQGNGDVVQAGDTIIVNYTGVEWETRKVFDSSWTTGRPASFSLDNVVPGFQQAVIGQRTGSRILVAIPPSEGYGDSAGSPVGPESTMLFVIDLLGVAAG